MGRYIFLLIVYVSLGVTSSMFAQDKFPGVTSDINLFLTLATTSDKVEQDYNISKITERWKPSFEIMTLEVMYFGYNTSVGVKLIGLLEKKTGQHFGFDFNAWYSYLWNKSEVLHPDYAYFKSQLHKALDPKFEYYFQGHQSTSNIRLDEIRWGGVVQDGIPPLRNPEMIDADQADYLEDDHIVFGIAVNGDVRAYPKRILAWHEMFTDTVGDLSVTGVYCTLCGTVILYKNLHKGTTYELGTSGFLYRSNKLMYDKKTQSLWSTLEGKPVVGALVNKGIQLDYLSVVTTTWGEWKRLHPETTVLSLQTGHNRNYGEGVAYKDYFKDDILMFNVPTTNKKLKNKQSVLAVRLAQYPYDPVAISTSLLEKKRIFNLEIKDQKLTVVTDKSGGNRLYKTNDIVFKKHVGSTQLLDKNDVLWTLYEDFLENKKGERLLRVPAFNAFWFGWQAAYPDTKLIK